MRRELLELIAETRRDDREESPYTRVYFIQEEDNGPIKIGSSKNVKKRMLELRCGTPRKLTALAIVEGGIRTERLLQTVFADSRIHGEWFRPVPELLEYARNAAVEAVEFEKREREVLFQKMRSMKGLVSR